MSEKLDASQSFALVGEPGPELIHFPEGTQIYPKTPDQRVLITFTCNLTEDQLREMVRQMVREALAEYES